ncbi:cytochrome c peroxidase [Thalassobaculum sp.]|uniref:cytochrome-c peroxidase n=1 Tax=Thalassobaculum sp. TaxID=2022740 RepID=UPI0032EFF94C
MRRWLAIIALFAAMLPAGSPPGSTAEILLTESEIAKALSHGPWPLPGARDMSNRASGDPSAIMLGRQLFFDAALSLSGQISCASCHRPLDGFTERKPRAMGFELQDRNTLALLNLRHQRWFGWGGQNDNLWAQSIAPLLKPDEMGFREDRLVSILASAEFVEPYTAIFGPLSTHSVTESLVNAGKLLAAYLETLETGRSRFDLFRDALAEGDLVEAATYPQAAQRGFKLFVGRGRCSLCHSGPLFSNGEFHDAGRPYFVEPGRVDPGRHGGIEALRRSPFTLDGQYSDDNERSEAWAVRTVVQQHANFGSFRVPGLRNVAQTAPYMHDGSLPTLHDVVDHYSNIDLERLHADGEAILVPLRLTEAEAADLVAFLESLSGAPVGGIPGPN